MQRSRLKNIVNKSKGFSKPIGEPFDNFKATLPNEVDENYRLEAAWKAYGSPKDFKEAVWNGMIQPIDENTYKFPSIGYNEETDEYEYLNKGKENEAVAKDIRVWDNDVIPLVKELKQGGYIRVYNDEKDCWTYSKNKEINSFKEGGKTSEKRDKKYKTYKDFYDYLYSTERINSDYAMEDFYNDDDAYFNWENEENKKPGEAHFTDKYKLPNHYTFSKESKYATLPFENGGGGEWLQDQNGDWTFKTSPFLENQHDLKSYVYYFGEQEPYSSLIYKGKQYSPKEIQELYLQNYGYPAAPFDKWSRKSLSQFKQGGQMNVIPEGALHARKNNMELAKEGEITHKGIPVVDNNGVQQAEVEKEELTVTKEVTDKLENWYKKFYDENVSEKEKDELAIKCGKFFTKEILFNTEDRVNLISKIEEDME